MYWLPYPFIRVVFALILGILCYHFSLFVGVLPSIGFIISGVWIAYVVIHRINQRSFSFARSNSLGFLLMLFFVLLGILRSYQQDQQYNERHIINYKNSVKSFIVRLDKNLQVKPNSYKVEGEIIKINSKGKWLFRESKILLYFAKNDSLSMPDLNVGDKIVVYGSPKSLKPPKNPSEFNYKLYLQRQQVYFQNYLLPHQYQLYQKSKSSWSWQQLVAIVQMKSQAALEQYLSNHQAYAVASALTLGIKDDLDNSLRQSYAAAGLMHILAVSGLHVGVITYMLILIFGGLRRLRYGDVLYVLLICILLWSYAFITGFSPSVVRAVLMFSLLTIGQSLKRNHSPFNTLGASAFILLVYNPLWIFSVGFQLSYLAVAGIFYLQPRIYYVYQPKQRFILYFWNITSVSLAAQVATFPLGLYYFGQFPNYFLLSNLLILPFIAYILGACFLLIFSSLIPPLAQFIGWLTNYTIVLMNQVIAWLEALPGALSENIVVNGIQTAIIYAIILCLILFFKRRQFPYLVYIFLLVMVFSIGRIVQHYQQSKQAELVIYHLNKTSSLGIINGKITYLFGKEELEESPNLFDFSIKDYLVEKGSAEKASFISWQAKSSPSNMPFIYQNYDAFSLLTWHQKLFVILKNKPNRLARAQLNLLKPDYCLIQNKSLWDLSKVSPMIECCKCVIIDGSNGFYRAEKLSKEVKSMGVKLHNTFEKGAFQLKR